MLYMFYIKGPKENYGISPYSISFTSHTLLCIYISYSYIETSVNHALTAILRTLLLIFPSHLFTNLLIPYHQDIDLRSVVLLFRLKRFVYFLATFWNKAQIFPCKFCSKMLEKSLLQQNLRFIVQWLPKLLSYHLFLLKKLSSTGFFALVCLRYFI